MSDPQSLKKLNPNQFAIPGMEHLSHPFAQHLPNGYRAEFVPKDDRGEHSLFALHDADVAHAVRVARNPRDDASAHLQWRNAAAPSHSYPGEILWADNSSKFSAQHPHEPGLTRSLLALGRTVDMGQTTVPVHSPDRTEEGDHFAQRTGEVGGHPPVLTEGSIHESHDAEAAVDHWHNNIYPQIAAHHPVEMEGRDQLLQHQQHAVVQRQLRKQPRLF